MFSGIKFSVTLSLVHHNTNETALVYVLQLNSMVDKLSITTRYN